MPLNLLHHRSSLRGRWKRRSSQLEAAHWTQSKNKRKITFSPHTHVQNKQTQNQSILLVPAGRSALLKSRLSARGRTWACSPGRSWARHELSLQSGHSRPDLCLRQPGRKVMCQHRGFYFMLLTRFTVYKSLRKLCFNCLYAARGAKKLNKNSLQLSGYCSHECLDQTLTLQLLPCTLLIQQHSWSWFTLPSCSPSMFWLASTKSQNFSWLSSARNSLKKKKGGSRMLNQWDGSFNSQAGHMAAAAAEQRGILPGL